MDKSVIEKIEQMVAGTHQVTKDLKLDRPVMVLPAEVSARDLSGFLNTPPEFSASFKTNLISAFLRYCEVAADEHTSVFIEPDIMRACAIIDMGDASQPLWGRHKATATLNKSPAYNALTEKNGSPMTQLDMIDFLQDWEEMITFFDSDKKSISFRDAINRIRKITVEAMVKNTSERGNFKVSQSALESIDINAGNDPLPAGFVLETETYQGFIPRRIHATFRAQSGAGKALLMYRIKGQELLAESLADEFRDKLTSSNALKETPVFIGEMHYQ